MKISEVTTLNKPYIRVSKGKKKIDIPIIPKLVLLPPSRMNLRKYAFVGCESIRFNFKGKIVKLNWAFNHNKMTLYCTSGRQAYSWNNIKVITVFGANGKKEHLVISRKAFGDETERRRHKRYPIARNVIILQGDNKFPATTVDISYGGVGITVKKQINLIPSQPIRVDFGDGISVPVRLVRSTFRGDGSELFGCSISSTYRPEMAKILRAEEAIEIGVKRNPKEKEDAGWSQTSIKRWH